MIYYDMNVLTIEAKLFAIRCSINHAISIPGIPKIIVITNLLYTIQRIFDSSLYPFQMNLEDFSSKIVIIQLNIGNVQVSAIDHFIKQSIVRHSLYLKVKIYRFGLDIYMSRSLTVDFIFIFSFILFYFYFLFFFYFLFLEQLGLGLICHAVTSVTT